MQLLLEPYSVYCTDLKLYDTFNSVSKTYFPGDYPARAFIGTAPRRTIRGEGYRNKEITMTDGERIRFLFAMTTGFVINL